jgi:ribosomal protein S18 acetylase RimI-like enzyme
LVLAVPLSRFTSRAGGGSAWVVRLKKMNHHSYLLELTLASEFRPKAFPDSDILIVRANVRDANFCKRLWIEVGQGFWNERQDWTLERWHTHLSEEGVSFWIAKKNTEQIGFFELKKDLDDIKIEGFGLLEQWRNRGLGGGLLSAATQKAFDCGVKRIWLHTATDDHPNALPNYKKRGYRIYHEDMLNNPMPNQSPEPTAVAAAVAIHTANWRWLSLLC